MNVLLVGDSIRIGYCQQVKEKLSDIAEVQYSDDNARFAKYILFCIREWIDQYGADADVVVLNCGLWDVVHMREASYTITELGEYRTDLVKIIGQIREALPAAKIIWASITPVDEEGNRRSRPDHIRYNADIEAFNHCAEDVMLENGCEICDLYAVIKNASYALWTDGVHYTPEGYALLANAVTDKICGVMSR